MVRTSDIDQVSAQQGVPVRLVVGATLTSLTVIRSLVESVLLTEDFSITDVADVLLGVDEIATQIITRSHDTDVVECSLLAGPAGVAVQMRGVLRSGLTISTDGFGWHVVRSVADSVTIDMAGVAPDRQVLVRLAKVRSIETDSDAPSP
ncbi:anti-sigma factor [Williamsia sp. MIQD14]|uniref:anti-sigma factor n=1 Tax=Williamsia sp. MIQD14 TaxID=3425703 RepID=UPI003DA03146